MMHRVRRSTKASVLRLATTLAPALCAVVFVSCVGADGKKGSVDERGRRPPNLIYVMADDLGWRDLGSYGQEKIRTPRLDRMAAEGLRFTQYYAGSTVCAPSRASLMTGMHTGHAWIRGNGEFPLRPEDLTVAEVLKTAGYRTGMVGKWGLGLEDNDGRPDRQGFDFSYGILHHIHAHRQYTDRLFRDGRRVDVSPESYVNDLFTEAALDFVRGSREQPFFLYLAYTAPHAELRVPEDSLGEYRGRFPEVPFVNEKADAVFPVQPPWKWAGYRSQREPRAAFAGMVTRLDRDVGRLLDLLAERGIDDDTIVFFTSDNGPHEEGGHDPHFFPSAEPLRGIKRDLYEGGIRVPMIVRGPGVPAGRTSGAVWAHWDVLPTLAELAGAAVPGGLDGVSQRAVLLGGEPLGEHPPLYWEFHERGFEQAARIGKWKAVRHAPDRPVEVYDLEADESESTDVAVGHPDVARRLEAFLTGARTESPLWPVGATGGSQ